MIFCENPLLFICISTRTSSTSTYHTFNNFSLKRNKDLNPNHYSSLAFTLGLYTFLYANFFTFSETPYYFPYWQCVTTQFLVVLGSANFPHSLTNQKHYTDLGELVMHHQYGISALASQTSFHRESSDDIAKCWLFSQANSKAIPAISLVYKFIQVFFVWKLLCPNFQTLERNSQRIWSTLQRRFLKTFLWLIALKNGNKQQMIMLKCPFCYKKLQNLQPRLNALIIDKFFSKFVL